MEKFLDISVIIPIHKLGEGDIELLAKAIESVKKQKVSVKDIYLIVSEEVSKELSEILNDNRYKIIINPGRTDFCSQVNYGASVVETKYFSILELDDEYSDSYFKNVAEYMKAYPSVSAYLPTTVLVNQKNQALAYTNESVWAQGFSEQLGFLDMASLLQYDNFMISGGIFKTEDYLESGGLKSDIKLYFNYEFLLRFINDDFKTMVIPKLGYKHLTDREGSLFKSYTDPVKGIKREEAIFFKNAAKKEYFFNPNIITRNIKYSPTAI